MKLLFATVLVGFSHSVAAQQTKKEVQARLDSFINVHIPSEHDGMTTADVKKIDKYDRPDLAAEQDFYMTIDPKTLSVPSEQKFVVSARVKAINASVMGTAISGIDWEERGPDNFGGRTRALMYDPTDSANGYKKVWAGGVAGGLWYNSDITSASTSWVNVNDFWDNMAVTCIAFDPTDDSTFYVGTGEGWYNADAVRGKGIWKSTDAGQTWSQLSSTDNSTYYYVQKIAVTNTGRVLAATRNGLRYSDNGGSSWSSASSGVFADIEIAENGDIYAAKGNYFSSGDILKSTNNGTSWSSVLPSGAGTIRRVEIACAPSDSNIVYAVAQNSSANVAWIKKTINGGSTWSNLTVPTYQNDASKDFTRGQAWYDLTVGVHPTNSAIVLVGGIDLHKSTDSGSTWSPISHWYGGFSKPYVHADQHAIIFSPASNNSAIFGNDGGVSYSSNVGATGTTLFAERVKGYNVTQFYSVALKDSSGSGYMLAGAQDNGSHKFMTSGINSTVEVTGGDGGFCFIDQDNPTYQVTSYVRNNFRRSINGGVSFSNITSNSTGRFINPCDYDNDSNIVYAASSADKLYRVKGISSTISASAVQVGGDSLGNRVASHLRCSPFSANTLFVGNDGGEVYKITAANSSPVSVDLDPNDDLPSGYISCIEVGASDSQLLVTFSNYGVVSVWETTNAGTSWQNKEGNLPNMPVRWALYNPSNRNQVLLATEVGVWSTDDLGATSVDWDPSNSGLANVRCDMLQIRESDNLVAVATHGRGVFTSDVFGDTSIIAGFSVGSSTACQGSSVAMNNTSTGNVKYYTWSVTPSTITFTNGTDSSSASPYIKFNASGSYTIKLKCSDSLATDLDSISISNAVSIESAETFTDHIQSFDAMSSISTSSIDTIWELDYTANYPWAIDSNYTTSGTTGPATDNSGTGNYLYAESSTPAVLGNKASVESECLEMPDTGYFSFAYHMYGSTIGSLAFDIDTGAGWENQVTLSGQQHSGSTADWSIETVSLGDLNGAVGKLRLTSTRGTSWDSDIALDDLTFRTTPTFCDLIKPISCVPSTINGAYDDGVHAVKIGTLEYTSSGVNVDGEYTDRVCQDTFSVADTGFVLQVKGGQTYSNRTRAYIDFNNDGQFDSLTEMISYTARLLGYRSDTIDIPASAVKNTFLRMRIMADDTADLPNNPCATLNFGESEDFGIMIKHTVCNATVDLGPDTTLCGGSIVLSGGSYSSYLWSDASTGSSLSVDTTGQYHVEVADGNGCIANDTIDVTIHPQPSVYIGPDSTQCGGSIGLDAGDFTSYLWSSGSTDSTISVSASGTYSVRATDVNGCVARDTMTATIYSVPSVNLGSDITQCGGNVVLQGGSFSSYSWSTGATTSSITVSNTGSFWVEVSDANSCTDRDTIEIEINNIPVFSLGPDSTQCGGSVELYPGDYQSYSWSTGSTDSLLNVTSSGTYSVTVTDSNSCSNSDIVTITILPAASISLGNDTSLCGGYVLLNASGYSSVKWSDGTTSSVLIASSTGTYWVEVENSSGCKDSDTIDVKINAIPTVNLGGDRNQCGGSVNLTAGKFSSYLWTGGSTLENLSVSTSGKYEIEVIDSNGCTNSDEVQVNIFDIPSVNLGNDSVQCGGSILLDAGSFTKYTWSTGGISSTEDITSTSTVHVEVEDANGCLAYDTTEVTILALPNLYLGTDVEQCGGTVMLDAGSHASYLWNTSEVTQNITTDSSGTFTVTVIGTNGCESTDEVIVDIFELPEVNLGEDTTQCDGLVHLTLPGFAEYKWSNGGLGDNIIVLQ
ncbi:MAG: GEVED domain-containing protein, partial [Bacteroidia bacterium]